LLRLQVFPHNFQAAAAIEQSNICPSNFRFEKLSTFLPESRAEMAENVAPENDFPATYCGTLPTLISRADSVPLGSTRPH